MTHANSRYKPEYAHMLSQHLKEFSFTSFGGVVGVSRKTLYRWVKSHRDFREVYLQKNKIAA